MNAIRQSRPPLHPVAPAASRATHPRRRSHRQSSHRATALEAGAKLTVNCFLAIAALSALVKLVPQNVSQQAKLQNIRMEVSAVESRVNRLQADFSRRFDPNQANSVMREQSGRLTPGQRQVIWVTPTAPNLELSATDPADPTAPVRPTSALPLPGARSY